VRAAQRGPSGEQTGKKNAGYCLQQMVAVMMIDKTAFPFQGRRRTISAHADPKFFASARRCQLVSDEELESPIPVRVAIVEVTLTMEPSSHERGRGRAGHSRKPPDPRRNHRGNAATSWPPRPRAAGTASLIEKILGLENREKRIREASGRPVDAEGLECWLNTVAPRPCRAL